MPLFTNEDIVAGDVSVSAGVTVNNFPATQPVSGTVAVSNFPATQPVSGTVTVANPGLTDTQLRATPVPVSGTVTTTSVTAATATVNSVSASTSVVTLLVSNAARKGAIISNEAGILYVKFGSAASSTSYTYRLTANTTLELDVYTGLITAIKASGTSNVLVTEL